MQASWFRSSRTTLRGAPAPCLRAGLGRLSSTATHQQVENLLRCAERPKRLRQVFAGAGPAQQPLFNRTLEKRSLTDRLSSEPNRAGVTVIVGPPSCGKTALVQHLVAERSQPEQQTGDSPQPIYIDCRRKDVTSPDSFAAALLRATKSTNQERQDVVVDVATALFRSFSEKIKLLGLDIDMKLTPIGDLIAQLKSTADGTPLSIILDAFEQALADKATVSPAIVIDEANKFSSWSSEYPKELDILLSFFVAVSKQQNLTHVLLLTSDYRFVNWMEQGVGKTFYNVQVIGDFPADEARQFFDTLVEGTVGEKDWELVYEVCGGNAGLLLRAANTNFGGDLQKALTDIIKTVRPSVQRGLEPSVDAGFTAQKYASAITAIVTGPAHAVLASELKKLLGGGNAGKEVLQALVRENLVAYRPYSTWATDINMDAFGPQQEEVVTAPTPAHLFCMRQLNLPDAPPADTGTGSAASDQEVAAVRKAVKDAEGEISDVKKELDAIETDITTAKAAADMEELRYLRQEKKQLREALRQLREEKLLLMQREASAT